MTQQSGQLGQTVRSRLADLRDVRLSRLNVMAWTCADSKWFEFLHKSGALNSAEFTGILNDYILERDQLLQLGRFFPSEARWARHHYLTVQRHVAPQTLWQIAGFITSRRFRVNKVVSGGAGG